MWERNQYPPQFYEPIVRRSIEKILTKPTQEQGESPVSSEIRSGTMTLQYRGRHSDVFAKRAKNLVKLTKIFTNK